MFVSIRTKLFILIVLANALMVAVLLSINAAAFNRSFSDYVAKQESRRMELLITNIAKTYDSEGDWQWLRWESPTWVDLVRRSFSPGDVRSVERGGNNNRPTPPPRNQFLERLRIKDIDDRQILGRRGGAKNTIWLPITSENTGGVIGHLGFEPSSRLDAQFDKLFSERLNKQLYFVGLFAFVIAAALAIPFSGWLVKPIRRLNLAMRKMTDGDLSVAVNANRNDELGQLADDFNRLAEVLKQNHSDRQQWVSDIAHELRTPVAVLQADIEAAQDGVRQVNDKWLGNMHGHAERLGRLVNDLHQLSQSDAGTLNYRFEIVDLGELADEIVSQFEKSCEAKFIDLQWQQPSKPICVRGDDKRLVQLLTNLAQNTLRYTDGTVEKHGVLKVSLIEVNEKIEIIWEDSSPGVGDRDLPKLFDRLYRVDESRSRESGGSGLGLAIVKNIVEAHDGEINATQCLLGGLRVTVTLPVIKEARV